MSQELLLEYEQEGYDQKMFNKDPEGTLRHFIAQQSNGHHTPGVIHSVVQLVMGKEDNKLKRLLYYFFETMNKEDKSFIVCLNQIKKDLSSHNEYVRGLVLKFIATLENVDYVLPLLRDIRDNLAHKCAYVRMNALFCLGEAGVRFDLEVEGDILATMKKESVPHVLIVGFDMMHKLGMTFDDFLDVDYPREIFEVLVQKNDDVGFLKRMLNSKFDTVSFLASCKLLSKGCEQESAIDGVVRILETAADLKQDFLPYLKFVTSHTYDLLNLIEPYDYEFSSSVIDTVFKNADTSEFLKIAEFLHQKYSETGVSSDKKKAFKIMLLNKLAVFSSTHCVYIDELVTSCLKTAIDDDPEIMYASLNFLETCVTRDRFRTKIHDFLINNYAKISFGKIFRKTFDVLSQNISREDFERLLDKLLHDMGAGKRVSDDAESSSPRELPPYLTKQFEVFVGAYIALCLVDAYKEEWNIKPKVIGTLLKLIEVGESERVLDVSSKATITSCVRSILSGEKSKVSSLARIAAYSHVDVLRPVEFSLLTTPVAFKKFEWSDPLSTDQVTVQLSGLGDPLYIEGNCTHSKYEISLDLLIINQTSSYLQNVILDFNFSKNIQLVSTIAPFSLQPNSATTLKAQFSILESATSFVTATVTFRYPRKDDYSGSPFVQNLSEIVFDVSEFLEGADIDFKAQWKNLEWENIYSIVLRKNCAGMLHKMTERINGKLCDKLESFGFVVGNIACYTIQKVPVLVNVCISSGVHSLVEIRVRAKSEELVKCISPLLAQYLKAQQ